MVRHGSFGSPLIFLPNTVPTAVKGRIINKQMAVTLNYNTNEFLSGNVNEKQKQPTITVNGIERDDP